MLESKSFSYIFHRSPFVSFAFLVTLENTDEEPQICLKQIRLQKTKTWQCFWKRLDRLFLLLIQDVCFQFAFQRLRLFGLRKYNMFSCVTYCEIHIKLRYYEKPGNIGRIPSISIPSGPSQDFLPPNCSLRCPPPAAQEDRILHIHTYHPGGPKPSTRMYDPLAVFLKMNYLG